MKNKNIRKLVAALTLMAVCGLGTGCGNVNLQDVLGQMEQQEEVAQESEVVQESEVAQESGAVAESTEESVAEESSEAAQQAESTAESTAETAAESATESTTTMSGEWTDMKFELAGKAYQLPFAYKDLEAEGWTFDLADYGYEGGYEMEPGDKVYATIDLTNPAYDEDLSIRVGFKNYSDNVLDIKECDVWSLELDTCYGRRQLESYPGMTIGNGLTLGNSKSDVEAACGPAEDVYESDSGYVKYTYNADEYTLKVTVYEDMGVTAFELSTYE